MSETSEQLHNTPKSKVLRLVLREWFQALAVVVFLAGMTSAWADETEEQYLRIYGIVQQAEELSTRGQVAQALAKYQQAQTALRSFQKSNADWNPKAVSYRLKHLAEKIATLSEKGSSAGSAASQAGTIDTQIKTNAELSPSGTEVKQLEAGAEPRKSLRLHPKMGARQSLTMTIKMVMDMKMGEMENPPMKLPTMFMS